MSMKDEQRRAAILALSLATALAGCGSDPNGETQGSTEGPLNLIHSGVQSTDDRLNYFTLTDDLASAGTIDYGQSLELPGRARLYAAEGIGFFAIGDGEDLTITRYELADDGTLVAGDRFSLQNEGVTRMGAQAVHFVSPTKAYYKDAGQTQIIVWNPSTMEIEQTIPLPGDLVREDHLTGLSDWAERDGEAYFAVSWYTPEYDQVHPGTALVRVDTDTDEVTVTEDERCRGLKTTGTMDGDLYFFSDVINGFGHAVYPDEGGQRDCILRVRPGADAFDPDYAGSLSAALPEGTAAAAMSVTDGGEVWAQAVDLSEAPSSPGSTYSDWYAAGWTWWHLPLATLDEAVQIDTDPGAYSGFTLAADGRFFVSDTEADYSATTLVDLAGEEPSPGVSFPGFTLDVARVR